jgi:hypothetical protein
MKSYSMIAQLKKHVNVLFVLEDPLQLTNVFVLDGLMQINLRKHLLGTNITFCFAFGFSRFFLLIILRANSFLSSILSTVKHSAKPPISMVVYPFRAVLDEGSF